MKRLPSWIIFVIAVAIFSATPKVYAQSEFATAQMPYDAFDKLPATAVQVEGGTLLVAFAPGTLTLPNARFVSWIAMSARAVSIYYGRFPVPSARILLVPVEGKGVSGGQAFGYRGAAVRLLIGRDTTESDLVEDWQVVHEMIHLALPEVGDGHLWLSEGLAVYVESIARGQAGDLTEAKIWGEFVRDMPQGLPEAADEGLDHTPTWGRTYWGGALFCLLADIEFRKRNANSKGLQEAARGVLAAGGNMEKIGRSSVFLRLPTMLRARPSSWNSTRRCGRRRRQLTSARSGEIWESVYATALSRSMTKHHFPLSAAPSRRPQSRPNHPPTRSERSNSIVDMRSPPNTSRHIGTMCQN